MINNQHKSIINVNVKEHEYPIYIEKGILKRLGSEISKLYSDRKIAVVTDSNVDFLYGKLMEEALLMEKFQVKKIVLEPGEKSKSFSELKRVCDELLDFGINRGNMIIAFGGGVVGDLTGFAASILLRGIPFIQIPTSLLAQIDSSIGGKVAVNTDKGKNLLGSFYHPKAVFIDPEVLLTLSERQFNDGMAEVIKYGAIKDAKLFNNLMGYTDRKALMNNIEEIIYTCCSIKKEVVELDEKDTGERMLLNFGHTIGHGIEKYYKYEKYTHGEAIAIGMSAITECSEKMGISEKGTCELIRKIIAKYDLPYELPDMDSSEFLSAVQLDKKNMNSSMNIVLLKHIGCSVINKIKSSDIEKYIWV